MSDDTQRVNDNLKTLTKDQLLQKADQIRELMANKEAKTKRRRKANPKKQIAPRQPRKLKGTDPTDDVSEILKRAKDRAKLSPEELKRSSDQLRADGRMKGQPVMEPIRTAIARYIDQTPLDSYNRVSQVFNVEVGIVLDVLVSAPALAQRAQQKQAYATLADMHGVVHQITKQINQGLADGTLKITDKYVRDFAVSMGIVVDKLQLLTGQPTERKEYLAGSSSSLDERKRAMVDVLERAQTQVTKLKALPGGKKPARKKRQAG